MRRLSKPRAIAACVALFLAPCAHAESFFQAEVGLGIAQGLDSGDGQWVQYGVPHSEHLTTPIYTVGFTGALWDHGNWSSHYHLDYVYMGEQSAQCDCVADAQYNPQTHTAAPGAQQTAFSGHGHTQGVLLAADFGYTWRGTRFALEGGPFVFVPSWHETVYTAPPTVVSHTPILQLSYELGARVERGPWSLAFRFFRTPSAWDPYPALVGKTYTLSLMYRHNVF